MAKGDGRIFRRGNRWWLALYQNGKEHRESAGTTEEQARDKLKTRLAELRLGQYVPPSQDKLTVGELMDAYLTHRRLVGRKTERWHQTTIGRVKTMLGTTRVNELSPALLEHWAAARIAEEYAPGTVRIWLAYLSAALKVGRRLGLTKARPEFPTLHVDNVRTGFFEPAQFEAVCKRLPEPIQDVARFGYLTGWRKEEILGLAWTEINRDSGLITMEGARTKTGHTRVLPLVGELAALIDKRWKARALGCPYVFHRDGLKIASFYGAWRSACVDAGVPHRLFHDLRRTAVRDMVLSGQPREAAKKVSGHRSDSLFSRYSIMGVGEQAGALDALQAYRTRLLADSRRKAEQG